MVLVIAQHCDLLPIGWIGVWIFFVISGFVVTSSVLHSKGKSSDGEQIKHFYFRRIARIVPMYLLYTALYLAILTVYSAHISWPMIASLLTFTYNFYPSHKDHLLPITHLWTISIEMQFYALVGIILIKVSSKNLNRIMTTVVIIPVFIRVAFSHYAIRHGIGSDDIQNIMHHISFFHFDAFAAGCMLALHRDKITKLFADRFLIFGFISVVFFTLVYAVINHITLGATGISVFKKILSGDAFGYQRESLVYVPVLLFSVGCVAAAINEESILQKILRSNWISYVGQCSYSGYLMHFAIIWGIQDLLEVLLDIKDTGGRSSYIIAFRMILFASSTIVTIVLSKYAFEYLEKPSSVRVRHWLKA